MSYKYLLFEAAEGVAKVTFNRPEALNALNAEVMEELDQILDQVAAGEEVKVVVLTGAGEKAFVAGADIKFMANLTPLQAKRFAARGHQILLKMGRIPQPVIAAVNGFCLGGGNEVALACDFVYASEKARFGQPEINLGVIPGFGGTQRLTRRVGLSWAKELVLTGAMLSAAEAKAVGLVNRVFPPETLLPETMKVAKLMAGKGRVALREAKTVMEEGFDLDLAKACAMEVDRFAIVFTSEDQKEGMTAFIEKRQPDFKGRL